MRQSGIHVNTRYRKRVYIETYGCQMNEHDSERMLRLLEDSSFRETKEAREADLILINTCSVREKPEHKVYSALGTIQAIEGGERNDHRRDGLCGSAGRRAPFGPGSLS